MSAWKAYTDATSGREYYANAATGETTWERPTELDVVTPGTPPDRGGKHVAAPSPQQQQQVQEQLLQRPGPTHGYSASADSAEHPCPVQLEQPWTAHWDEEHKRHYYFNHSTQETRWDPPPNSKSKSKSLNAGAHCAPQQEPLHPDWDRILDPATQRYYYVHKPTQKVQWEPPPAPTTPSKAGAGGLSVGIPEGPGPVGLASPYSALYSGSHAPAKGNEVFGFLAGAGGSGSGPRMSLGGGGPAVHASGRHILPTPLRDDILKFQMQGFAENHFRTVRKRQGFSKKAIPMEDVLKWQAGPLDKSLLASTKQLNSVATTAFKHLQRFMGDEKSSKNPATLAASFVATGVKKAEMRDELFCQVCKQTTRNPNPRSVVSGWKIMAMCCASFPPSRGFQDFLKSYIAKNYAQPQLEVQNLAPYCFWRLEKTLKGGPSRQPPRLEHIEELLSKGVPSHTVMFGGSIEYILKLQAQEGRAESVPFILHILTEAIWRLGGPTTTGMFRVAADRVATEELRAQFERGQFTVTSDNPHVPGDLLKIWLRELSDPVVPTTIYNECLKISNNPEAVIKILHDRLPHAHLEVMSFLMRWLRTLAEHAAQTSMTPENLAIVFCQNLLKAPPTTDPSHIMLNSEKERNFIKHAIVHWPQ